MPKAWLFFFNLSLSLSLSSSLCLSSFPKERISTSAAREATSACILSSLSPAGCSLFGFRFNAKRLYLGLKQVVAEFLADESAAWTDVWLTLNPDWKPDSALAYSSLGRLDRHQKVSHECSTKTWKENKSKSYQHTRGTSSNACSLNKSPFQGCYCTQYHVSHPLRTVSAGGAPYKSKKTQTLTQGQVEAPCRQAVDAGAKLLHLGVELGIWGSTFLGLGIQGLRFRVLNIWGLWFRGLGPQVWGFSGPVRWVRVLSCGISQEWFFILDRLG